MGNGLSARSLKGCGAEGPYIAIADTCGFSIHAKDYWHVPGNDRVETSLYGAATAAVPSRDRTSCPACLKGVAG